MPWVILGSAFAINFTIIAAMSSVPPMEHILKEQLHLTHAQTSLLFTAPIIMMIALSLPAGILADRIGIRKAAGISAIIAIIGSLLRGTATDYSSLLAFTFIYGAGLSQILPNLPKLVSTLVPQERAGMATGIFSAGSYAGLALPLAITMSVIFPITNTFQGTFIIWTIPAIIATIVWWRVIPDYYPSNTSSEPLNQSRLQFSQVLRNKTLWLLAVALGLHHFFNWTWAAWTPALMMQKGATPEQAAFIASITMWAAILSVLLLSRLSDRLGLRKPFILGPFIILALASWGITYTTIPMSWSIMFLIGMVHGIRFATIMVLPVELMPKESVGVASGLVLSVSYIGGIIGPLVGGYIFDLTGSIDMSFIILAAVQVVGAVIAFRLPETGARASLNK